MLAPQEDAPEIPLIVILPHGQQSPGVKGPNKAPVKSTIIELQVP